MNGTKPVVAVIGAGRMGIGIAQVFACAGHRVHLLDAKDRGEEESRLVLSGAKRQLTDTLGLLSSLGLMDSDTATTIAASVHYRTAGELEMALTDADVVFEAVPEVLAAKEAAFKRACRTIRSDTLIASTTSTFLVDTLAKFVTHPERFMNTHWLNPAYLIPLVEVSPGQDTSAEASGRMLALLEEAGKVPVKCAASPGFIVPRIQTLAMNEAARLVEEGVASPEEVDKACRVGFGLRFAVLGLLEFIDWGGGDTLYYASHYLRQTLENERFAPPDIISRNMENGDIGMKSGRGFYDFANRDVTAYQRETIKKFIDLLVHLDLLAPPGGRRTRSPVSKRNG